MPCDSFLAGISLIPLGFLLLMEGLLLGQRLSLPGVAGKKAMAENSTFTLSFLAQEDGRENNNNKNKNKFKSSELCAGNAVFHY